MILGVILPAVAVVGSAVGIAEEARSVRLLGLAQEQTGQSLPGLFVEGLGCGRGCRFA
jgi:hypothetical protein